MTNPTESTTRHLSFADFADALKSLDDNIEVEQSDDLIRIVATLPERRNYAKIATDWRRRTLTPRFLAEVAFQLGEIAEREEACKGRHLLLVRGWYYVSSASAATLTEAAA